MSRRPSFGDGDREQIDPFDAGDHNLWRKAEYLGRYLFAADFLGPHEPRVVADIACGLGYGTWELAGVAKIAVGVDSSQEHIEAAVHRFKSDSIRFLNRDLESDDLTLDIAPGSTDAVVSFETLEHLVDPENAVLKFSQMLKPGGFLLCSVPNAIWESGDSAGLPRNKSHKQWFRLASLMRMVETQGLRVIYRLGQSWSKSLHRREQQLSNAGRLPRKLADEPLMHRPDMLRWLSYVAAYPTVEDVDGSYSLILVAQKSRPGR